MAGLYWDLGAADVAMLSTPAEAAGCRRCSAGLRLQRVKGRTSTSRLPMAAGAWLDLRSACAAFQVAHGSGRRGYVVAQLAGAPDRHEACIRWRASRSPPWPSQTGSEHISASRGYCYRPAPAVRPRDKAAGALDQRSAAGPDRSVRIRCPSRGLKQHCSRRQVASRRQGQGPECHRREPPLRLASALQSGHHTAAHSDPPGRYHRKGRMLWWCPSRSPASTKSCRS